MCWVFWGSVVQLRTPSQLDLKLDEPQMAQDWPHGDQEGPEMTQDKAKMAQGWPPWQPRGPKMNQASSQD